MRIDLLWGLVVSYFRPAATSVSPPKWKIPASCVVTPAALDRVEEAAQRIYGVQQLKLVTPADWAREDAALPDTAIKPPDEWTWDDWSSEFASLAIDGWAPCRFAHRAGRGAEKAIFVFGVVRGAFGLWQQPFDVCYFDGEHHTTTDTLTVITHLRSGIGMGVFATRGDAAQACSLAARLAPWESVEYADLSTWAEAAQRTMAAWHEFGIVASVNAHAHDPDTGNGPFPIMGLSVESAAEGKPEKLS